MQLTIYRLEFQRVLLEKRVRWSKMANSGLTQSKQSRIELENIVRNVS